MNKWTFETTCGHFAIVERASRGVDLYFVDQHLGHYRTPVEAAEAAGNGTHPELRCAPEDGKSLGVPPGVHNWTFSRAVVDARSFRK